jgi:CMP-N-acetylneuraminic acid synthetase
MTMQNACPKIIALLPMKANSERVRGKNFRDFNGRPLFRWVLDRLLDTTRISAVVINTDAADILRSHGLSESPRVILRDRKPELCGDFVSMNKIIADDIVAVDSDIYLMTHVTNPLLGRDTLEKALDAYVQSLRAGTNDSLFSVNRMQTRFYDAHARPINHDPSELRRTQDLEPWYEENSNLYLFTKQSFAASGARIGCNPMLLETPKLESIDIDDQEDWDLASIAARYLGLVPKD